MVQVFDLGIWSMDKHVCCYLLDFQMCFVISFANVIWMFLISRQTTARPYQGSWEGAIPIPVSLATSSFSCIVLYFCLENMHSTHWCCWYMYAVQWGSCLESGLSSGFLGHAFWEFATLDCRVYFRPKSVIHQPVFHEKG